MVAITRSAAAHSQPLVSKNTVVLADTSKRNGRKKKEAAKQCIPSITTLISSQTITTTIMSPTSSTFKPLYLHPSNLAVYLDNMALTVPPSSSTVDLFHHKNIYDIKGVTSVPDSCIDSPSNLNLINSKQQDDLGEPDDSKDFETMVTWPIAVGDIAWCKTNPGNDRICMDGFTYDYMSQSLKKNYRSFRCSRKDAGCRSVVKVYIDSSTYNGSNNVEHKHPPNHHHIKRLLVLQRVKDRVLIEPTAVTRIIEDEYVKSNLCDDDRHHFLLPSAQASKFYKIRGKLLPPNPKSSDFEVPQSYSTTNDGEDFLLYDSTSKKLGGRLMIFSTQVLLQMLCDCEIILIDGTFKTRPMMFSQVYAIMGQHLDEAIPLVWCLTPKRTQEVYEKIFKVLKTKSMEYGFTFEPQGAYLDFEIGTINALEKIFPNISVHGCWYHYTQCIYRNIQKIGLATLYEKNKKIKVWLRCFMALPLVKKSVLQDAVDHLIDNPPSSDQLLVKFQEYFKKQWPSSIPTKYWNLGPVHLRCNNSVEGTTVQ